MSPPFRIPRPPRAVVAAVAGLLVVYLSATILFEQLGGGSLEGDEAIHATVARGSAAGPWLPLRFGDRPYLAKPPLKILAQAAVYRAFGVSPFTTRVLDAAAGVATLLAVFVFGLRLGGPAAAALAALLPLAAHAWVLSHNVRSGTQDAVFSLLLVLALFAWFRYAEQGRQRRWGVASALLAGAAMLVKGPLALLLLPALLLYEAALWRLRHPEAPPRFADPWRHAGLALLPPLAWAGYLAAAAGGGRLLDRLRRDLLVRATRGVDPSHLHGPLFYAEQLGRDFGWWLLLLVPAALVAAGRLAVSGDPRRAGTARRAVLLLGLWAAVVLGGLSLSASKLAWYVFPAYPALALLAAAGAAAVLRRLPRPAAAVAALLLAAGLAAGLAATWRDVSVERRRTPTHRLANAIAAIDHRLLIKRDVRLRGEGRFYLGPLGRTVGTVPREFWAVDGACRFLLRGRPMPESQDGPGPRSFDLPSRAGRGKPTLWLIDLDRCLPPDLAMLPF